MVSSARDTTNYGVSFSGISSARDTAKVSPTSSFTGSSPSGRNTGATAGVVPSAPPASGTSSSSTTNSTTNSVSDRLLSLQRFQAAAEPVLLRSVAEDQLRQALSLCLSEFEVRMEAALRGVTTEMLLEVRREVGLQVGERLGSSGARGGGGALVGPATVTVTESSVGEGGTRGAGVGSSGGGGQRISEGAGAPGEKAENANAREGVAKCSGPVDDVANGSAATPDLLDTCVGHSSSEGTVLTSLRRLNVFKRLEKLEFGLGEVGLP